MTSGPDFPERGEEGVGYSAPPGRAAVAQLSAMLAGPVLYLLALSVKYGAVHAACRAGSTTRLHVVAALFLLAVVAVAIVCHRAWRRFERPGPADPMAEGAPDRHRVTMLIALMLSVLFALGVVLLWLPVFALDPCRT
jgi:hypothetical protein